MTLTTAGAACSERRQKKRDAGKRESLGLRPPRGLRSWPHRRSDGRRCRRREARRKAARVCRDF
jgi:hypothetical protein